MRYLKEWPRLLLTLPSEIRLSLLTLFNILCLGIYILTFPVSYTGYLLVIPVGLAAWMFQKRGLVICLAVGLAVLLVYHSIRLRSIWWPFSFALFFWGGFFILLLVGYITVIVRTLVDSGNVAQLKVEHARQQAAIAYDQQRQLNQLKDHF